MTDLRQGARKKPKKSLKKYPKNRSRSNKVAVKKRSKRKANKTNAGLLGFLKKALRSIYTYVSLLLIFIITVIYVVYLDFQVRERFEGRLWSVPSKVYARVLDLKTNMILDPDAFEKELHLMAYEEVSGFPQRSGQFRRWNNNFELISRDFKDSDVNSRSMSVRLEFEQQRLINIEHLYKPEKIESVRLDPVLIGSIFPDNSEDRKLLKLSDVPERLVKTLVAVEDRSYFEHIGVNPLAIMRALMINIRAGEKRQGGSTLTQQLVKNLFLSSERSYWRKLNEAIMAVLLEVHYDKDSILEAYINEVYLGQSKRSSVHGFELGSQFYFNKPLNKLSTDQIALLIGLIKGPSYFNPRRNSERARKRRDLVLNVMHEQNVISKLHFEKYKKRQLSVVNNQIFFSAKYPAFIDLVKRQLKSRFSLDMIKHEGLQIFSTFDPQIQLIAEQSVKKIIKRLQNKAKNVDLQTAVIVSDVKTSEVLALVGDKEAGYSGFNRALDASRQIGSLIKPAIYLAALNMKRAFNLSTVLSDEELVLKSRNGDIWRPQNYDKQFRGNVIFHDALVFSYNIPSVRLGLKIGLEEIVNTLRNLGLERDVPIYPSMLLGAFELTPFEVANMYSTIAADGNQLSLHTIKSVLSHDNKPLVYYAEQAKYTINKEVVYLIKSALHDVTQSGTAKKLSNFNFKVAGKTGTTDNLRDSWYAGFSEDKLAVVWVGNDDNQTIGLTGAGGALNIWSDLFQHMPIQSLRLDAPDNINYLRIDRKTGLLAGFGCDNTIKLPFLNEQRPTEYAECE